MANKMRWGPPLELKARNLDDAIKEAIHEILEPVRAQNLVLRSQAAEAELARRKLALPTSRKSST